MLPKWSKPCPRKVSAGRLSYEVKVADVYHERAGALKGHDAEKIARCTILEVLSSALGR